MSNMKFIFLLFFTISFVYTSENNELEVHNKLRLVKAEGELIEYQRKQIITLSFKSSLKIIAIDLIDLIFAKDGKNYKIKTKCFEVDNKHYENSVKCEIDLVELAYGIYIINSFRYKNKIYLSKVKIEILKKEKKISNIKLINLWKEEIIEYRLFQSIKLLFDNKINANIIKYIKIQSDAGKRYNINTRCSIYEDKLYCSADFSVKGGKYKIIYVSYGEEIITSKEDLFFDIKESIIHLKNAYNDFGAPIANSRHSMIQFTFDKNIENDYGYFIQFSFTNVKNGKTYYSYDFRRVFGATGFSNSERFIFDFHKIPPGDYYINYVYKFRSYHSKVIIRIEPVEIIDLSKIYQDRDLCENELKQNLED